MTLGSNSPAARFLQAIKRRGQRITLRSVATYSTAFLATQGIALAAEIDQRRNPPTIINPRVVRAGFIGQSTFNIEADSAIGVFAPGDKMRAVGMTEWRAISAYTLAGNAAAANPLSLAMASTISIDGTPFVETPPAGDPVPVEFSWLADSSPWVRVESFPMQLVDGKNILAGDLRVSLPAYGRATANLTRQSS